MTPEAAGLAGLFLSALAAATLLPGGSEVVLGAMLASGRWDPVMLVTIATAGNVLGSTINWAIGRFLAERREARWFPVSSAALDRAEARFKRYGLPVLLLSWVPVIGDPLTLIAGLLRVRLVPFLLFVGAGKAARYGVIALAFAV